MQILTEASCIIMGQVFFGGKIDFCFFGPGIYWPALAAPLSWRNRAPPSKHCLHVICKVSQTIHLVFTETFPYEHPMMRALLSNKCSFGNSAMSDNILQKFQLWVRDYTIGCKI